MKTKQKNKKLKSVKGSTAPLKPIKVTFTVNPLWNKQLKRVSAEVKKLSKIPYMTVKV